MDEKREYAVSFEAQNITASTLDEFIKKVEVATNGDAEISNIVAIVVTRTISNP